MKKYIKIFAATAFLTMTAQSCETNKVIVNRQVESKSDGQMLLGTQTKDQLLKEPFSEWYNKEHDEYSLDQASVAELKKAKINSYQILVFMGTWCEDSHREVPRLMKILEATDYPQEKLTIVAVNRKKESPGGEDGPYNIHKVPTIIVKKYGKELGRIVEFPKSGFIEKDLLEIVKRDNSSIKDLFK